MRPALAPTDGYTLSGAPDVTWIGADQTVPLDDVTSLTWFDVTPLKLAAPVPQLPAPSLSAQALAIVPFDGSIAIDGKLLMRNCSNDSVWRFCAPGRWIG